MVQNQLARIGHELAPQLNGQAAEDLARFAINWVRDHPGQIQNLANAVTGWVGENVPAMVNRAYEIGMDAALNIQNMDATTLALGLAGGVTGGVLGGPGGAVAGAIAAQGTRGNVQQIGETLGRNIVNTGGHRPQMRAEPETQQGRQGGPQNRGPEWRPLTNNDATTLDNLTPGRNMDNGPPGQPGEEAARISGPSGANGISKETPISSYPNLTYGLQETHTTVLPWVGWVSAAYLDKDTPLQLKIRMNTPWDMLDLTTQNEPTDGTRITTKGFYAGPIDDQGRYADSFVTKWPVSFGHGASTAHERPQWRDFWAKLYDYYTVLGCEWEVIAHNPIQAKNIHIMKVPTKTISTIVFPSVLMPIEHGMYNSDMVIAEQYDTYTDVATTTGNVMPLTYYEEIRAFKDIKWHHIPGGQKAIIRGHYKPGQTKRNIVNDGDIKTWTATGTTLPNFKETLTLNLFCDPFYNARVNDVFDETDSVEPTGSGSSLRGALNFEIKLKYIVQFKDLKLQARYPNSFTTNQDIQLNLNENKGDSGNPLMSWTTASA